MPESTNNVNTNDWLEVTKGMTISAFVETLPVQLAEKPRSLTKEDSEQVLTKSIERSIPIVL